jgi:hypothetical protein
MTRAKYAGAEVAAWCHCSIDDLACCALKRYFSPCEEE